MRKHTPPCNALTFEREVSIIKSNSFAIALVLGFSFVGTSVTLGQESKGYAPVNGIKMYYEIHGNGSIPLVLIHGGGSTIETTFGYILPILASKGKIIAVELQAHGRTSDRDVAESFEQDADDVAGLLAYLKVDKADFFGFSNGGNTAMQIAIRHPAVVNKLVIVSSFYKRSGLTAGFFNFMQTASLDNMPAPLKTAYKKVAADETGLQIMHDKDKERMIRFQDWSNDAICSINAPTLLIIGNHDIVIPEHALEMSRLMPHAELVILPGTHGSCIGEICTAVKGSKIPELTAALIQEFLGKEN
jgi:pimeloyl-ACP methyl ester carboxylesterase